MQRMDADALTDDEIATRIRDLGEEERPPSKDLFNADSIAATSVEVEERFDSWEKAVKIAGFDPNEDPITPEEVKDKSTSTPSPNEESNDDINQKGSSGGDSSRNDNGVSENGGDSNNNETVEGGLSEEELITEIEKLATNGTAPTLTEFTEQVEGIHTNKIYDAFESWTALVEKTSLEPQTRGRNNEYTQEDLIDQIEELSDGDTAPTTTEFKTSSETASVTTVNSKFGSWNEAIEQTSLEPNTKRTYTDKTEEELLTELKQYADGDQCPTIKSVRKEDSQLVTTILNRFEKWTAAAKKAGLQTNKRGSHPKYTREELKEQIKSVSENETPPTAQEFNAADHTATLGPIRRVFGSWSNALNEIGYDQSTINTQITEEEVIEHIHIVSTDGKTPTATEFKDHKETCSLGTVVRIFGSWNNAVEEAGYEPNEKKSK